MKRLTQVTFILLLSACTKAPEKLPEPKKLAPKKWASQNTQLKTSPTPLSCHAWWKSYHDKNLNFFVNQSLKKNNTIYQSIATIEAAKGEAEKIKYQWLPKIDGLFGFSSFPAPGFPGILALVVPSYTLNLFSQINQQKKSIENIKVSKADDEQVKVDIISQTISSYFLFQSLQEKMVILKQIEKDLAQYERIYSATYKGGLNSEIELAKAKSELALIKTKIEATKKAITVSGNMLNYLINQNPQKLNLKNNFNQLSLNTPLFKEKPISVIENHPQIKAAAHRFYANSHGLSIAISQFLPTAHLSLARGEIGEDENSAHFGQQVKFNESLLAGPLIDFSLIGEVNKQKGIKKASFYAYIDSVRRVFRDIDNAISINHHYHIRLQETKKAYQALDKDYRLQKKLYKKGLISYQKLLKIKTKRDNLRLMVNQNKVEELLSIVQLYQHLAAGFDSNIDNCKA